MIRKSCLSYSYAGPKVVELVVLVVLVVLVTGEGIFEVLLIDL